MSQRIINLYSTVQVKEGNPIKRLHLYCRWNEITDTVLIDPEIPFINASETGEEEAQEQQQEGRRQVSSNQFSRSFEEMTRDVRANSRQLHYNQARTERELNYIRDEMKDGFNKVIRSIQRISPLGVLVTRTHTRHNDTPQEVEGRQQEANAPIATLSPHPRTLADLWTEYEHGIGGRKAARLFTSAERGKSKYKYYKRNIFWSKVEEMIRRNYTASTAIDKIQSVYGPQLSVTEIIKCMKRDKSRYSWGEPTFMLNK